MNTKGILAVAAVAIVAVAGGIGAGHWLRHGDTTPATAAGAPQTGPAQANAVEALLDSTMMHDADGKPKSLAAFKGQTVVVNFWASWCGPCVEEMPTLAQLNDEYSKKGVKFIGIGVDSEKNVKAFLQKVPVDYPVYVSGFGGADLARNFGNTAGALPFTVVIDANGAVRSTKLGQIQPAELKKTLDSL
ncbi:TlpA family protein disulfide reductase [Trinickia violacea]|uniref:TlpA family protein disulfide reductase n=1 Tax=Trinickia violacea TaxID=2571746 RepID=A0A4P8IQ36_9BURK|nr:TlpA disulfide reductase family protein [Trinickia violacea]QCP51062.1 TlpA family protein disulfide reductase [Trinickia violacea]